MNESILRIAGLTKKFASFELGEVGLTLPAGYIMGLIGPNGAGKTTTISLILNKLRKDAGEISVFGLDSVRDEIEIKKRIGYVSDSCYFPKDWTAADCGGSLAMFYGGWNDDAFRARLSRFGIEPAKKVKDLSKGMKMKLMIACALSYDNRLLILDEPTSGLDPVSRDELLDILSAYIEDGTRSVLFSTHITADLERVADYVTYLDRGRVFYTGELRGLLDDWVIAKGGAGELTDELRAKLKGLRVYATGFEGLLPAREAKNHPALVCDAARLDDIMVFMQKTEGGSFA